MDIQINEAVGLGMWLGRRQAFGLVSGKCSAADAECLRQMRDEKKYVALGMNWEEFCKQHVGVSRQTADRIIRNLEEFGPKYFELSAVLRIPAEQCRQIAPAVTDRGVVCGGETIEIAAENSSRLAQALDTLRESAATAVEPVSPTAAVFGELARARKAFTAGMKFYTRAMELNSPAVDRAAIRREIENVREVLQLRGR
jgi:hypothetical protein